MPRISLKWLFFPLIAALLLIAQSDFASRAEEDYPLAEAPLLNKALYFVRYYYLDPDRMDADVMFEKALDEVQKTIPEVLAVCERPNFCTVTVGQGIRRFAYPGRNLRNLGRQIRSVFTFMELHLDPDTEKKKIEYAAIDGLLAALDPHSSFFTPEAYQEFQVGTEGEFGGLGIVISLRDGKLTVMSPLEGTPAWSAGIKPGDRIVQIEEESTINMSLTEAVNRLRGPVGSKVAVKIEREGIKGPKAFVMTRAVINIDAVQSGITRTPGGKNIAVLKVKSFQSNTEREFLEHLTRLTDAKNKITGILLDLRNNPGGLLDQSVILSDIFLKQGTIVSTVGRGGKMLKQNRAALDGIEPSLPVIVLLNEGSASASEILAGALKNNNRAVVLGQTSFGKGSVQSVYTLPLNAALKLTVAQYLTPGNRSIQSVGIIPDIELRPVVVDRDHADLVENVIRSEKDLTNHLEENGAKADEKPFAVLPYPAPPPGDEETAAEYSRKLDLEGDTAAAIALRMMDVIRSGHRPHMIRESEPVLKNIVLEEEKKISEALAKMGVDWEPGASPAGGHLEVVFQLLRQGKPIPRAKAGEKVSLRLKLKNAGKKTLHQVVGQTVSEDFLFKNIEFVFGKMRPEETKIWESELEIPVESLTEEVPLQIKFFGSGEKLLSENRVMIPIEGKPRPQFAVRYHLRENWVSELRRGKTIPLEVEVKNIGLGEALKPIALLKNLGGKEAFIETGRAALKPMAPGASEKTDLRFHIDPAWDGESLDLELSVIDADLLVQLTETLRLRLKKGEIVPPAGTQYAGPVIRIGKTAGKTGNFPFVLKGDVADDTAVRDLFIFINDQKVFYKANTEESPGMDFRAPLQLKEGANTILITARDDADLVSNTLFTLFYDPALAPKGVADKKESKP